MRTLVRYHLKGKLVQLIWRVISSKTKNVQTHDLKIPSLHVPNPEKSAHIRIGGHGESVCPAWS